MNEPKNRPYRTLISGVLIQKTALAVQGRVWAADPEDCCYRDGMSRLTLPATGLAGSLVETARRIQPGLVQMAANRRQAFLDGRITGKLWDGAPKREERGFLQSVWRFENAHPRAARPPTEWRQGVGIRQATGAAAQGKRVLYDFEAAPAGTRWSFFLEVDTARGGPQSAALAILALEEWRQGRAWLGGRAARGLGWCAFEPEFVLHLTCDPRHLELWPDNTQPRETVLQALEEAKAAAPSWEQALQEACGRLEPPERPYVYLSLDLSLEVKPPASGDYGFDPLFVGGHEAGRRSTDGSQEADATFVLTQRGDAASGETVPFVPGSSLRGPLRHEMSRLARQANLRSGRPQGIPDPNVQSQSQRQRRLSERSAQFRACQDPVTGWLGSTDLAARLLVSDGEFSGPRVPKILVLDHHAEDEFTAGTFAQAKFAREILIQGRLAFRVIVELGYDPYWSQEQSLIEQIEELRATLWPALAVAHAGHLPVGGGKWRGNGWLPWRIDKLEAQIAGAALYQGHPERWPLKELQERCDRLLHELEEIHA